MYVYACGLADPRKGNFKMNGTAESTKKIIEGLNSASLNPDTGSHYCPIFPTSC